jgi:hypothetical protein
MFIEQNTDGVQPKIDQVLIIDLVYTTESGDTLFSSMQQNRTYMRTLNNPAHPGGSIEDALSMMHVGDSAVFRIDAYNFYKYSEHQEILPKIVNKGDKLLFYIRLKEIVLTDDFSTQLVSKYHSSEEMELELLDAYLERTNVNTPPINKGLYFVSLEKGYGKRPAKGDVLKVHYSGSFIDGKPFDSSYGKNPYSFVMGSGQVIEGWEIGIAMMQEGESARLIIPSSLAYGAEGKGEILPYSTLVFDVELISVQ